MAPELRQDWSNLLPQSDIYSLGALLYEILVGRSPAPHLRLPSELSPIFGIDADEIILKSMAPNASDRFGTAEAFKLALEALQSNLLKVPPPSGLTGLPPVSPKPKPKPEPEPEHVHLDVISDVQAVHNPDLTFTVPLSAPLQTPQGRSGHPEHKEIEAGDRTLFYPNPAVAESQKVLADLDSLGDRIIEEAHANRSFAHKPLTPLPSPLVEEVEPSDQVGSESVHGAKSWQNLTDKSEPELDSDPDLEVEPGAGSQELEEEPVAVSVWISLAIAGLVLVALSAYFGMSTAR
jgi:serine/threonine protein kinase